MYKRQGIQLQNAPIIENNDILWIFGGYKNIDQYISDKNIYSYHTLTKEFSSSIKMHYDRANHKAFKIDDKVYILGGVKFNSTSDGVETLSIKKIEVFNLKSKTISEIREMPEGLSSMGAVSVGEKIYVMNALNEIDIPTPYRYIYYPLLDNSNQ